VAEECFETRFLARDPSPIDVQPATSDGPTASASIHVEDSPLALILFSFFLAGVANKG
jgi:hypothetical protein